MPLATKNLLSTLKEKTVKELQQIANEKLGAIISEGVLDQMIEDQLNKTVKDIIGSAMRSHSDYGKALSEKIEGALVTSLKKVTLPEYGKFMQEAVLEVVTDQLNEQGKANVIASLDKFFEPVAQEITFEDMCKKIKEYWGDDCIINHHEKIQIEWEGGDGAYYLKVIHPEYDGESIRVTFYNYGNPEGHFHLGYINADGRRISGCLSGATYAKGLLGFFYKMYCQETVVTDLADCEGEEIYLGSDH